MRSSVFRQQAPSMQPLRRMPLTAHASGSALTVAASASLRGQHRTRKRSHMLSSPATSSGDSRNSTSSSSSSSSSTTTSSSSTCLPRLTRHSRPRLTITRASSSNSSTPGDAEGEVYQVQESEDDLWASIALPVTMNSAEGQQVEYLVLDTDGMLVEPAVETYLQRLQQERDSEAAALQGAEERGEGADDAWALDPTLLKRMAAVRDAERGQIVQELMYLMCIKRLKDAGLFMVTDLGDAAPSGAAPSNNPAASPQLPPAAKSPPNSGQDAMGRRMERMMPLVSLAVADSILGYVGAAITNGMQRLARDTPLRIDRVQAARLYAGMLEFGYFCRGLEAECAQRGIQIGNDSEAMIRVADALPEDKLRSMCQVQTADGWYTAVRHVGGLFGLRQNPDLQFDSCALPYSELYATISDMVVEPASSIPEHYSPPGTTQELMRKARRKQDRGWQVDAQDTAPGLPEADLVLFCVGEFGALLVEAAVLGCLIWEAERRVQHEFGYRLEAKATRQQHASKPEDS